MGLMKSMILKMFIWDLQIQLSLIDSITLALAGVSGGGAADYS